MWRLPILVPGIPFVRGVARLVGPCLLAACFSPGADITGSSSSGGTTAAMTGTTGTGVTTGEVSSTSTSTSSSTTTATATTTATTTGSTSTTGTTTNSLTTGSGSSTTGDTDTTTGSTSSTSDASSTTGALDCGDGNVDVPEECDDGNSDANDGCGPDCKFEFRYVFVTSTGYTGAMGSLAGYDAGCTKQAGASPALKGRTFVAWMSDSKNDAKSRIGSSTLPYFLTDNTTEVASNTTMLLAGTLKQPINRTEFNVVKGGSTLVWTGTNADGTLADNNCMDWSQNALLGVVGEWDHSDVKWSNSTTSTCLTARPIYCVEKPA